MPLSFVDRIIEVSIKLATATQSGQPNSFAGSGGQDTVTLSGHRTAVRIEYSGAPAGTNAQVSLYGLAPNIMNQLTTLGIVFDQIQRNTITIQAGDAQAGLSTVFVGTIVAAYGDYNAAPDVAFHLVCQSSTIDNVAPTPASSFTGTTDVATVMAGFARQMNLGFINNGVNIKLASPYFAGNIAAQLRKCADHAHINAEPINGILYIWPKGKSLTAQGATIPLVSKNSQMKGYPTYTAQGIIVEMVFNPQISFGSTIKVESTVKLVTGSLQNVANAGLWVVYKLDLALDAQMPHGQWKGVAHCFALGFPAPIPQQST